MEPFIIQYSSTGRQDIARVGGKNASIAELYNKLTASGILVPAGFAVSAFAFQTFLQHNQFGQPLQELMQTLDKKDFTNLRQIGEQARKLVLSGSFPDDLAKAIRDGYLQMGNAIAVAVRSSATAEDLPDASFAGLHESYLNIRGAEAVLDAVRKCYASLYTDRAIKYREDNGFEHGKILLSAGIQQMVRSDTGSAGVAFTLEPESGFRELIHISGVWGLGENIVQGTITPDEFFVFKPTLRAGKNPVIQKKLGSKALTMIFAKPGEAVTTKNIATDPVNAARYVLSQEEVILLAKWCLKIEEHYGCPMDIEWAKDGTDGRIYIVQARPETVHSKQKELSIELVSLQKRSRRLAEGNAVGARFATGTARVMKTVSDADHFNKGDIIVAELTTPDWDPLLKQAGAIVTDKGGRTSHASIVARELGIPAIVGCGNATSAITNGEEISVSCCEGKTGYVYEGILPVTSTVIHPDKIRMPVRTSPMLIAADPEQAFRYAALPQHGIGLMRIEFIINHSIGIHPMALARYDTINDDSIKQLIDSATTGYKNKRSFFIEKLSEGIATLAAAVYPKPVIVRLSDFKSNEYARLLGGRQFEEIEENPMLGFRGASRYDHERFREAFAMECEALRIVRNDMGLTNVKIMIPFCRTTAEGEKVIAAMAANKLDRAKDESLEIYMMVEIPSNVLLEERFAEIFDGFSIGSNDLTQLTLGIDRDSSLVSASFNEQDPSVKMLISSAIKKAKYAGVKIGLCGQAPSDIPSFAAFLVREGIDSISFNPDALLQGIANMVLAEQMLIPEPDKQLP
ncbi:MAG: phosphoenolpyruvate synthase [Citrobacter freundii]|nr:MAG: phosphoenolpyruvate synthase [Citrobacter freundii]